MTRQHGIGDDLGLGVRITEKFVDRFERNVSRPDSLGRIVLEMYDDNGNRVGVVHTRHDGSDKSMRDANDELRAELDNYGASNIQSRSGATDENGKMSWIISPNGQSIDPVGSDEAAYTLGNTDKKPASTACIPSI